MLGFSPLAAAPLGDDGEAAGGGDALYAAGILSSAATVEVATLGQTHVLGAATVTSTITLSTPVLVRIVNLAAAELAGTQPSLGAPGIAQTHTLASSAVTSTVVLTTPQLQQGHTLGAVDVTATVVVGTAQIAQTHMFGSTDITASAPVLSTMQIKQRHALLSTTLTGAAATFLPPGPRLRNRWALTAVTLTAGAPVLSAVTVGEFYATRRRHVSVTLSDDVQPVADLTSDVMVTSSTNAVAIEVDGSVVEVYGGANFAAADNANSAVGAYVGQTQAE